MKPDVKYALVVAGVFTLVILCSKLSRVRGSRLDQETTRKLREVHEQARSLRQAAEQDSAPLLALMHATSAVAKTDALAAMLSNEDAQRHLGVDLMMLRAAMRDTEARAMRGVEQSAPALALNHDVLQNDIFLR